MIETVSRNGGHLAASLGAVELAIALHYVFTSPADKLIWDVGHQSYAHKLLTGRGEAFSTLRQPGGLGGFPRREESEHDAFGTGHGSTSIAAALGLAKGRDLAGSSEQVIAIIGDGAMTGGLALEALNAAGHLKSQLLVVLNDNAMSIGQSVGALAGYLSRLRTDPHYLRAKDDFEQAMRRLPLGESLLGAVERVKDGLKQLLVPGMLFEELGFTYLGPVDGHDLEALITRLRQAHKLRRPALLHVLTQKGKGYPPAEEDACRWHRCDAFDIETGEPVSASSRHTFTRAFGDTLVELAEADSRLVAITAAMRDGTGLSAFAERFPDRFFDVGMAEQTAVAFAAGLAARGLRPVVAIYSTFLQRAYDQILHDVALQNLRVVFALDRAGLVGEDGPTHHGAFDLSYLRHIPGLAIMAPADLEELAAMLKFALQHPGPVALRYPRGEGAGSLCGSPDPIALGQARVLMPGEDLTLFAVGSMVGPALAAAERLREQGVKAGVVNARFVKPLDERLLCELAQETGRVVTIEENSLPGGFGSAVLEALSAANLARIPVLRLGLPDEFVGQGPREWLLESAGLGAEQIAEQALAFALSQAPTPSLPS